MSSTLLQQTAFKRVLLCDASQDWPFAWYKEWPYNFDDFPDFHAYMYGSRHQ